MYNDGQLIPIELAIKYLRQPGNAYVNAKITPDDVYRVKVEKAGLIHLFRQMPGVLVGYSTFNDGSNYPAMLFDAYGM